MHFTEVGSTCGNTAARVHVKKRRKTIYSAKSPAPAPQQADGAALGGHLSARGGETPAAMSGRTANAAGAGDGGQRRRPCAVGVRSEDAGAGPGEGRCPEGTASAQGLKHMAHRSAAARPGRRRLVTSGEGRFARSLLGAWSDMFGCDLGAGVKPKPPQGWLRGRAPGRRGLD